jgi:hypothetical protein
VLNSYHLIGFRIGDVAFISADCRGAISGLRLITLVDDQFKLLYKINERSQTRLNL